LGTAAGVLGAFALTRVLRDLLFGISRTDVTSYGTVVFFLGVTALVASWIPARRAARADPIKAMNSE
jgi:ABC-type antimicrobial peptide transport system permease subunit